MIRVSVDASVVRVLLGYFPQEILSVKNIYMSEIGSLAERRDMS